MLREGSQKSDGRCSHAAKKVDGRRLAGTIVAQEREHLAFFDAETNTIHCQLIMGTVIERVLAEHLDKSRNFDSSGSGGR